MYHYIQTNRKSLVNMLEVWYGTVEPVCLYKINGLSWAKQSVAINGEGDCHGCFREVTSIIIIIVYCTWEWVELELRDCNEELAA